MKKTFRIQVFGKPGCDKCHTLNQRLDRLLGKEEWQAFEKVSCQLDTEDGLIAFAEAECVNPQRIPAMLVLRHTEGGEFRPMPNPAPGRDDAVCKQSRLHQYLGLQTDYSDVGGGVISPKMIRVVLNAAQQQAAVDRT